MGKIGGKLSERHELRGLFVGASEFADAIKEQIDASLVHGGHGLKQGREMILVQVECPEGAGSVAICTPGLHAGIRKLAGERAVRTKKILTAGSRRQTFAQDESA